jgi:uncharacterized Zn finger protein
MAEWWEWSYSGPRRPAKDGIRARSRRGDIGESWWSKRFIAVLESLTDPGRLGRGRSYARSGQVMELRIAPGEVTAAVQGSRPLPYEVSIRVPRFAEAEWERAEEAMGAQALFLATLLAGEMPRDIEDAFTAAGLSLFPTTPGELETSCTCPDWANPCKHSAAVLYILAEAFDQDPFLILTWRGRAKEQLLADLRARRAPTASDTAGGGEETASPGMELAPLPADPADFWSTGAELEGLRFLPRAPERPDALLAQLGVPPVEMGGLALATALRAIHREVARGAEGVAGESSG